MQLHSRSRITGPSSGQATAGFRLCRPKLNPCHSGAALGYQRSKARKARMETSTKVVFEIMSRELENERKRLERIENKATKYLTIVSITTTVITALSAQISAAARVQVISQSISGFLFAVATALFLLDIVALMGSIAIRNYPVIEKDFHLKLENYPEDVIYYNMTKTYGRLYKTYYDNNNKKVLWIYLCQWAYVIALILSILSLIVK